MRYFTTELSFTNYFYKVPFYYCVSIRFFVVLLFSNKSTKSNPPYSDLLTLGHVLPKLLDTFTAFHAKRVLELISD